MSRKRGSAGGDHSGHGNHQKSRELNSSGESRSYHAFNDYGGGMNKGIGLPSETEDNGTILPNQKALLTSPAATGRKKSKCSDAKCSDDSTDEVHNLDTNTYDAIKVIGHGSFGCVFLAKVLETGQMVAIKESATESEVQEQRAPYYESYFKQGHPPIYHSLNALFSEQRQGQVWGRAQ